MKEYISPRETAFSPIEITEASKVVQQTNLSSIKDASFNFYNHFGKVNVVNKTLEVYITSKAAIELLEKGYTESVYSVKELRRFAKNNGLVCRQKGKTIFIAHAQELPNHNGKTIDDALVADAKIGISVIPRDDAEYFEQCYKVYGKLLLDKMQEEALRRYTIDKLTKTKNKNNDYEQVGWWDDLISLNELVAAGALK